jgi:hypothetical protein
MSTRRGKGRTWGVKAKTNQQLVDEHSAIGSCECIAYTNNYSRVKPILDNSDINGPANEIMLV